jgi:hypothetical protein
VSAQQDELIEYIYELPRPIPLAHPVLFGKAGRIVYGRGTGIMMKGTEQHSARDEKRLGNERVSSADRRQCIDECAWILRIILLARQSDPYASQQEIRGVLLDSYC